MPTCLTCGGKMFSGIIPQAHCTACCAANPSLALDNEERQLRATVAEIYRRHQTWAEQEAAPFVRRLLQLAAHKIPVIDIPISADLFAKVQVKQ